MKNIEKLTIGEGGGGGGGGDYSGLKSTSNQSFKVDGKNNTWNSLFDNGRLVYDYFLFL